MSCYAHLLGITRPFPVCDTESDSHLGWLSVACVSSTLHVCLTEGNVSFLKSICVQSTVGSR